MPNPYKKMLPQLPQEDKREAIEALRQFAEALQQYPGDNMDVEVTVNVHPEDGPDQVQVLMSVYVPKTDYVNLILVANCQGQDGFPVKIDPYFAGGTFPNGMPPCHNRQELDDALEKFSQSREMLSLLEYVQRHARPR